MASKKNERVQKLVALHNLLKHQKRSKDGSATFNEEQLKVACNCIEEVLRIDNIFPA